jgi:hypothetical protein
MKTTKIKTNGKTTITTHCIIAALLLLAGTGASRAQNFSGTDSLTETTENTTDWKTPDSGVEGGAAFTSTTSGLQYTDTTNTNDNVDRKWQLNVGSYTQNWTLQLNVNLSGISLGNSSQKLGIGLQLGEANNFSNNNMELDLFQSYSSGNDLYYTNYVSTNGSESSSAGSPGLLLTNTSGAIELSYDAADQTISAYYDNTGVPGAWTLLSSTDIATGVNDWDMTSANAFIVDLQAFSDDTVVSSSEGVYATDFIASSVPEPSTWAMLLGGIGVLAFWGLRTRRALV